MSAPVELRAVPGPVLFARYAFPPNSHGYCGPPDNTAFLEMGSAGVVDAGMRLMARQFEGAWPYLELIAGAVGIPDPLDPRVVEAYWVGNGLLPRVGTAVVGDSMEDRFRHRAGPRFATGSARGSWPPCSTTPGTTWRSSTTASITPVRPRCSAEAEPRRGPGRRCPAAPSGAVGAMAAAHRPTAGCARPPAGAGRRQGSPPAGPSTAPDSGRRPAARAPGRPGPPTPAGRAPCPRAGPAPRPVR